ncbi:hypothetical protein E9531_10955 [Lampropedia puyangensis]|uniref:PEP-CTERM sorting domain-containing protein n=1 Tax=Lampropedia puyangensis TaxID=1330072 RepID=A0A4S8F073_9BURK|nr:hypothetical protein [Lampropedia puyangensis]THU00277.1 hypothetical protein E9531_10955 [Lampropedia puyangensis]
MTVKACAKMAAIALALSLSTIAAADSILVINSASTASEPEVSADITAQLPQTCGTQHQYTVVGTPPTDLTGYAQIWDIRYDDEDALLPATQERYRDYLEAGGRMFLMGENSGFAPRNDSLLTLIDMLGGGSLHFYPMGDEAQTITPPFDTGGLNSLAFVAAGGTTTAGTGVFATSNSNGGTAVAWAIGSLNQAPKGSLTVVFDVNFMLSNASLAEQQLFRNLCQFVSTGGNNPPEVTSGVHPVPVNTPIGLLAAISMLGLAAWRRAPRAS